jgi:diguanylate cyclase (GGDEF)-like protein
VSSLENSAGAPAPERPGGRTPAVVGAAYALLGVLLLAYLATLIVRPAGAHSDWLDGWAVDVFEVVACAIAFSRAARSRHGRGVTLAIGLSMVMWTLGDIAITIESLHGAEPPTPSPADIFYVGFYPAAYLALVLLLRRESSRLVPATWLDGAVAGLGAAALCAAFVFHSIQHVAGGSPAAVATVLAYPVGDVLLLAMAVGGSVLVSTARGGAWRLLALGCAVNAIGDGLDVFTPSSHLGGIVDGVAWPAALVLMSGAVWVRRGRSDVLGHPPAPGFLLPGLGAASGIAILLFGSMHHVDPVAVGLATATLLVVCLRLGLSVGSLRRLTDERHRQAVTDQLTGLGNRRRLAAVLDAVFADHADPATSGRTLAFLFVDLDRFKEVNDSFGHPAGDQLLAQIGPRFERCLDPGDLLVRIGGDELAVVLLDCGVERALAVAARLSAALEEPFPLEMVSVRVGASIGIALAPEQAADPTGLMRCADKAMYRSKQAGTPFEVFDPVIDAERDRLQMVDDLRAAIAGGALDLHYQPEVDLRDGTITAVEALLRWRHPRHGDIPPLEFLPLAEEGNLMRQLTSFVLDRALAQCARWRAEGRDVSVAVNVSATNIMDAGFTDLVRHHLGRHGLPAGALVIEITETTVISDFERCRQVTADLAEIGCVVSIDDFGAGFTSLPLLSRLAVGELKLDRAFLKGLAGSGAERDRALVRATIELAHNLGLKVVAEGVEERATLDLLETVGCDLAQGYHLGRPSPATALRFERDDLAA